MYYVAILLSDTTHGTISTLCMYYISTSRPGYMTDMTISADGIGDELINLYNLRDYAVVCNC